MAKPRIHEVAKELGVTSKEVLAHLEKIGEAAKSHASTIDESLAERVKSELSGDGAVAQAAKTSAKKTPAEKTPAAKSPAKKTAAAKTAAGVFSAGVFLAEVFAA